MGTVPQKVLNWLHGAINSEYRNVQRTYSDVAQTLSYNPNFALRTDVYTYENGRPSLLLNIRGTLPVSFRGTTYAFPISVWVPQEYPNVGPIGFVTPTKDMTVRPGQYVSGDGRIYHPYLAGWRGDRSSLNEFLSVLKSVFAHEPPVIARQEILPRQPSASQQRGAPPPIPPLPPELVRSDDRARRSKSPTGQHPPYPPPKPFDARSPPNIQVNTPSQPSTLLPRPQSQYNGSPRIQQNGYSGAPPPMSWETPQRDRTLQNNNDAYFTPGKASHYPNEQPRFDNVDPIGPGSRQTTFQPDQGSTNQTQYSQQRPQPSSTGQHQDEYPPTYQGRTQRPQPQHSYQQAPLSSYQMQRHPPQQPPQPSKPKTSEDLLTSPFETVLPTQPTNVAPPPIPPNPQKDALLSALSQTLTQQIHSSHANNLSALPPLRAQQAALTQTQNAINREISQLNDLEALLTSNENILHQAMRDSDKVLEDAKRRTVPNIDEVLVAPTVVAEQLYQSVAEERAIEESRGVLGRALDKGKIGGGVWAKQTRSLAREEFLKKALIKKIARGMAISQDGTWT
ncbi:UEV domain-containing protein [Usnea florida]